ncbi:MAG: hypothetical protein AB7G28_03640 [Pirellulales bacterium]
MDDADFWLMFRRAAKLSGSTLQARVNLDRPDEGIQAFNATTDRCDFRLLSISPDEHGGWPAKLVDTYTRGGDTVAAYAGTESWPFAPQIYWTAETNQLGGAAVHSLSVVISIQTDRLDTHPQIFVRSSLPADEVLRVSVAGDELLVDSHADGELHIDPQAVACCQLWRLPGGELTYAEIVPASDFSQLSVERVGRQAASRWKLFAEFLEKGVIRRARLQAMFLPREDDVQLAAECCQAIDRRPLPLTT